eukprot:5712656-Pyramimonas_sp.AAC.1
MRGATRPLDPREWAVATRRPISLASFVGACLLATHWLDRRDPSREGAARAEGARSPDIA